MLHSEVSCASVLSAVALTNQGTATTLSMLTTVAPRPQDAAGLGRVCRGSLAAVRAVVSTIGTPAPRLQEIEASLDALAKVVDRELQESGTQELALPMLSRTGRYRQWSVLAALAQPDVPLGAHLAAGAELLRAWKDKHEITKAATLDIAAAIKDDPLTLEALRLLLDGVASDEDITSAWHKRLRRSWRQVALHFAIEGSTPPPANFEDRVRGQLIESSVFASPARRAGASDHRQLSMLQIKDVFAQVGRWIDCDDFRGAYGFFVCNTGLSIDLMPMIPLQSASTHSEWIVVIDVAAGCLKLDVSSLAPEAARASTTSDVVSSYVCSKPLPEKLVAALAARLANNPNARCLSDLYPEATTLDTRTSVVQCHDQITPSWARLRKSAAAFIRNLGIDNLLACLISGDFAHIPKSKLYYACVEPQELLEASARFYQAAGWGTPVAMPTNALAFGCRVVPTDAQIRDVDRWWLLAANSTLPAKHCALAQVLEHHNRFVALTCFRLATLFALREQRAYPLRADIDERCDHWLAIHDKNVPGMSGPLPLPVTTFSRNTIKAVRAHCRALQSRLHQQSLQHSELARWSDKVVRRQDVPLLMKASSPHRLQEVGSQDCLGPLPAGLEIAPDFGRKLMENKLRRRGLRTGDIDALLRHSIVGQSRESSASDFTLLELLKRVIPVVEVIAVELFGEVYFGLSKE